jgi:hypothetical protein
LDVYGTLVDATQVVQDRIRIGGKMYHTRIWAKNFYQWYHLSKEARRSCRFGWHVKPELTAAEAGRLRRMKRTRTIRCDSNEGQGSVVQTTEEYYQHEYYQDQQQQYYQDQQQQQYYPQQQYYYSQQQLYYPQQQQYYYSQQQQQQQYYQEANCVFKNFPLHATYGVNQYQQLAVQQQHPPVQHHQTERQLTLSQQQQLGSNGLTRQGLAPQSVTAYKNNGLDTLVSTMFHCDDATTTAIDASAFSVRVADLCEEMRDRYDECFSEEVVSFREESVDLEMVNCLVCVVALLGNRSCEALHEVHELLLKCLK